MATLLLAFVACTQLSYAAKPASGKETPRAQLSIGYSLLYQEADGIPKLEWLLVFKDKSQEMGQLTDDLAKYYRQLADRMHELSRKNTRMRIDREPLSRIEADARKAIGADLAKDLAPVVGKSGTEFEREALLMFFNSLNEQRHLVGVMQDLETDPQLQDFLHTTKGQLDERYARVGRLLSHRYFTH